MGNIVLRFLGVDDTAGAAAAASRNIASLRGEVLSFAKEAAKAWAEQEQADLKLAAALTAAGDASDKTLDAFKAQAGALQMALGVSDDYVQSLQARALMFGAEQANVDALVRTSLDLNAALGIDAESAMRMLTLAASGNEQALRRMGVQLDKTKLAQGGLNYVIEELTKRGIIGQAEKQADSLATQMKILDEQVNELKESIGHGLIIAFTGGRGLKETLHDTKTGFVALWGTVRLGISTIEALGKAVAHPWTAGKMIDQLTADYERIKAETRATLAEMDAEFKTGLAKISVTEQQWAGKTAAEVAKAAAEAAKDAAKERREDAVREADDRIATLKYELALKRKADEDYERGELELERRLEKRRRGMEAEREKMGKEAAAAAKKQAQEIDKLARESEQKEIEFAIVGVRLGVGLMSGILDGLKAKSDAERGKLIAKAVARTALAGIAAALKTFGGPWGALAGEIIGGIGGVAVEQFRSGGVVGLGPLPQAQGGAIIGGTGERGVPIIAHPGEVVLNAASVQKLASALNRGQMGGSTQINVSALDARSFTGYMGGDGGRAIYELARIGQGRFGYAMRRQLGVRA